MSLDVVQEICRTAIWLSVIWAVALMYRGR